MVVRLLVALYVAAALAVLSGVVVLVGLGGGPVLLGWQVVTGVAVVAATTAVQRQRR